MRESITLVGECIVLGGGGEVRGDVGGAGGGGGGAAPGGGAVPPLAGDQGDQVTLGRGVFLYEWCSDP